MSSPVPGWANWRRYLAAAPDSRHLTTEREACDELRADAFKLNRDVVRIVERPPRRIYAPEDADDGQYLEAYRDQLAEIFLKTSNFARCVEAMQKILQIDELLAHRAIGIR